MIPIQYNLRSLTVRKTSTLATLIGIALVVFVLAASLMLAAGIQKTLGSAGKPDVAVVVRKGSDNELGSVVEEQQVSLVKAAPGVALRAGVADAVAEVIVVAAMDKIGASGVSNVTIRGVPEDVLQFRPTVRVIEGRAPLPGADEAMIGRSIRGRFRGLDLGQSFDIRKNRPVTVVGVFDDAGSSYESEVWTDFEVVRTSFRRDGIVSSMRVRLTSPAAFDGFKAAVEQDPRLGLEALREPKFFEKQSEGTSVFIGAIGTMVAVFFAIGAIIGAAITMFAAVANRQRDIGVLRALGFGRSQVLISFLLESLFISLAGGALGTLAAMGMGFVKFSMMNFSTWSEIVFTFEPTLTVIAISMGFSAAMGLFGGLLPAIRAARVSPVVAMRGG